MSGFFKGAVSNLTLKYKPNTKLSFEINMNNKPTIEI